MTLAIVLAYLIASPLVSLAIALAMRERDRHAR